MTYPDPYVLQEAREDRDRARDIAVRLEQQLAKVRELLGSAYDCHYLTQHLLAKAIYLIDHGEMPS